MAGYGSPILIVGNGDANGAFSGAIQNTTGALALTKTGAGTQVLSGSNTYSGPTTISGGTLQIGNGTSGEHLASASVAVNNNATLAFSHSDTLTYSGAISGSGQATEQGGGMLILSGSNSYSGGTTVNASTLQIGNGTSGEYFASPSIALSGNATLEFNHADAYPGGYGGAISGSGQFVKAGSGSLTLNGEGTYTGETTISAGTLVLGGADVGYNLPATTALSIAAGAALDLGGNKQPVGSLSGPAGAIILNNLSPVKSHTYTATLTVSPTSGATTFAGNIVDSTLSSSHGNVALTMSGNGELTLNGSNAYSGGTSIGGGTLEIAAGSALPGSGLVSISGGGRLVLGSGAGIGALLAASAPAGSDAIALSAAASAPATVGGYESSASGNMAALGGAPPLSQGGGGIAVGSSAAAVPEPGTVALLAAGILLLAVARRRRRACGLPQP